MSRTTGRKPLALYSSGVKHPAQGVGGVVIVLPARTEDASGASDGSGACEGAGESRHALEGKGGGAAPTKNAGEPRHKGGVEICRADLHIWVRNVASRADLTLGQPF